VKPGQEFEIEVTDAAYGGDGLGRHDGRVVFVPFTIPGETVRVRVAKVHRSWLRAEPVALVRPSPDRVAAPCPFFGACGGCVYQHVAYPRQLALKTRQVSEALRRLGGFEAPPVEEARPSPLVLGYRNRITVHIVPPDIGFRGTDPRRVVDVDRCLLADDAVNAALAKLRGRGHHRPGPATLRSGPAGTGFRQVNDSAAAVLGDVAAEMAGAGPLLVDAYCGSGFFAKRLRDAFTRVVGLDWDAKGIASARQDARPGEEYLQGDAAEVLPGLLSGQPGAVVLLDPPAQGLDPRVIGALLEAKPARIVYVSCDPATLARDLAKLGAAYRLSRAVPVDMFPQTASIETVTRLDLESAPQAG
jgi:23S rRNA (uracil1939-C5)-methyltransferase